MSDWAAKVTWFGFYVSEVTVSSACLRSFRGLFPPANDYNIFYMLSRQYFFLEWITKQIHSHMFKFQLHSKMWSRLFPSYLFVAAACAICILKIIFVQVFIGYFHRLYYIFIPPHLCVLPFVIQYLKNVGVISFYCLCTKHAVFIITLEQVHRGSHFSSKISSKSNKVNQIVFIYMEIFK